MVTKQITGDLAQIARELEDLAEELDYAAGLAYGAVALSLARQVESIRTQLGRP